MSALLDQPHKYAIRAEEFLRMGEAGVFAPEARLELIEGEIIEMAPIKPPHAGTVNRLASLLFRGAGDKAVISVQNPLLASALSVPQPDLALLAPRADFYAAAHPGATEVLLVVEVSDTSLAFDLNTKIPLYARCGIREVWIVDVVERAVHVFRSPAEDGYRSALVARGSERVACDALPEVAIQVSELFPT